MAANKKLRRDTYTDAGDEPVEQVLYIDPEETITTIRERLEQTPKQCIALVIPAQTQMRSHVAWRLLQRRARELGKHVSIISTEPHILAIARSVQLKAVSSLADMPR